LDPDEKKGCYVEGGVTEGLGRKGGRAEKKKSGALRLSYKGGIALIMQEGKEKSGCRELGRSGLPALPKLLGVLGQLKAKAELHGEKKGGDRHPI